jgi:hypothetical protein
MPFGPASGSSLYGPLTQFDPGEGLSMGGRGLQRLERALGKGEAGSSNLTEGSMRM